MAKLFKREWTDKDGTVKTSKTYYARFQVNGKEILRSTGKAKKGEAVQEMQRMIAEVRDGTGIEDLLKRLKRAIDGYRRIFGSVLRLFLIIVHIDRQALVRTFTNCRQVASLTPTDC